ncbi:MAG: FAD-dependent oxidoreductase [Dehalococcoidia bacterium]|nr:FAD-dependent oxidoreductase [Dehalococcoidia bacterium]
MKTGQKTIVIGNGIAGYTACCGIKEADPEVAVTLISEEKFPLYSPPALANFVGGEIPRSRMFLKRLKDYKDLKIVTRFGQKVDGIDLEKRLVYTGAAQLDFDTLVVATGSRATVPPIEGIHLPGVFTFKTMADADNIIKYGPKTAVVAGAGPMGIEAAMALKKRGARVILVATRWALPRVLDEKAGRLVQEIMERNGVEFITWDRVKSVEGSGKVERVVTEKNIIACDTLIMAAGVKPEVELAREAGIKLGNLGGITVDATMSTGIDGVYACGDCIESHDTMSGEQALNLLWINSRQQGYIAGLNTRGADKKYTGSINIRVLNIFGVSVSSFGVTADTSKNRGVEIVEKSEGDNYYRLLLSKGQLLGGQWVGRVRDTGVMISLMRKHASLDDMAGMIEQRKMPYAVPLWFKAGQYASQHFSKM